MNNEEVKSFCQSHNLSLHDFNKTVLKHLFYTDSEFELAYDLVTLDSIEELINERISTH